MVLEIGAPARRFICLIVFHLGFLALGTSLRSE